MSERMAYIIKRILVTIPVLFAMSIFVFLLIRLVPGDPVRSMLGVRATPQNVSLVRWQLGLDRPLVEQYATWLNGVIHGNFGNDFITSTPISQLLSAALPVTLELTIGGLGLALIIGVPLGVLCAKGHRWIGRGSDTFVVAAIAIPNFWLGLLLVLLFTGVLNWLPPTGYVGILANPLGNLRDMVMPILTLACAQAAVMLKTTRGSMEGVLGSPYILFHRAKGLQDRSIVYHHALRNASGPIITIVGIEFGTLLGGAIVIENLFGLPGVGQLVVSAISARDYVVVQGGVFTIAAIFIIVNLITDIVYGLLNPRAGEAMAR
jgi:peptide/nickel transport system permease protein